MKFYKPLLVLGSFFLLAGCAQQEKLTSISLDPEADKVLVNTDTDIRITTDPKNIQLIDSDFATLGANISVPAPKVWALSARLDLCNARSVWF